MQSRYDILIVGAGHAGAQAAITLRQRGFEGSIGLIGDEPHPPYERPPLSKDYFSRAKPFERILLRPESFWAERSIDLLLGRAVTKVSPEERRVTLSTGEAIGYGDLIWAAGGAPRRLTCPGHDLPGVHGVRTRDDVDRMMTELDTVSRVAVIGGGYIGLEAAAVLTKLGKAVTLFEAQDRVLARVAGERLSRFFEEEHRAHGVDIRLSAQVDRIEERNGRAGGVRLSGGEIVAADMVIVGIGILPSVEPLLRAGAEGGNGVAIDAHGRTTLRHVYAIGDCALHVSAHAHGRAIRLESVQNANDLAITVAKLLTGTPEPYEAMPWFWSNQYDLKLQTAGLAIGYDREVVRGDPAKRSFSVVYLRQGEVIAVDSVNMPRDFVQARALVTQRARIPVSDLEDVSRPLKSLVPA